MVSRPLFGLAWTLVVALVGCQKNAFTADSNKVVPAAPQAGTQQNGDQSKTDAKTNGVGPSEDQTLGNSSGGENGESANGASGNGTDNAAGDNGGGNDAASNGIGDNGDSANTALETIEDLINFPLNTPGTTTGEDGDTPLVLDWDRDGAVTTATAAGRKAVRFDLRGDGHRLPLEWIGPNERFLALDLDADGVISSGMELFGDAHVVARGDRAAHGFAALAQYDRNHDGKIDAADPVFASLVLWQDADSDGVSDPGELTPVAASGVTALEIAYLPTHKTLAKSHSFVGLEGVYVTEGGTRHALADVYFRSRDALRAVLAEGGAK
jgi:hypothetical protein